MEQGLHLAGSGPQGSGVCENYPQRITRKLHLQPGLGFQRLPQARQEQDRSNKRLSEASPPLGDRACLSSVSCSLSSISL